MNTNTIMHGDMPGDKVEINDSHRTKAARILPVLLEKLEPIRAANPHGRAVVCVCGGSGVGKSEIASLLGQALQDGGLGCYVLSGDNYPHRIPAQNDAAHCLDAGKHPKDLRLCPGQLSARKLYRPAEGAQIPTHILSPSRFPIHRESCIAARIRRYF